MGCTLSRPPEPVSSREVRALLIPGAGGSKCDADLKRRSLRGAGGSHRMVDVNEDETRVYACRAGRRALDESTLTHVERDAADELACLDACLARADCRAARWGADGCRLCLDESEVVCSTDVRSKHWLKVDNTVVATVDVGEAASHPGVGMQRPDSDLTRAYVGAGAPVALKTVPWRVALLVVVAMLAVAAVVYAARFAGRDWRSSAAVVTFVLSVTVMVLVLAYL